MLQEGRPHCGRPFVFALSDECRTKNRAPPYPAAGCTAEPATCMHRPTATCNRPPSATRSAGRCSKTLPLPRRKPAACRPRPNFVTIPCFPATQLHRTQNNYFLSSSRQASDAAHSVPLPDWRTLRPTSAAPVKTDRYHMPPTAVPSPVLVRDKQRTADHTTEAAAGSYCSDTRCKPFIPRPAHTPFNERGHPQKPDFPAYLLLPGHSLLALATSTRTASHTTGAAAGFRCRAHDVPRSGSFEATHKAHKKGGRSSVRPCRKAAGRLAGTPHTITRNR